MDHYSNSWQHSVPGVGAQNHTDTTWERAGQPVDHLPYYLQQAHQQVDVAQAPWHKPSGPHHTSELHTAGSDTLYPAYPQQTPHPVQQSLLPVSNSADAGSWSGIHRPEARETFPGGENAAETDALQHMLQIANRSKQPPWTEGTQSLYVSNSIQPPADTQHASLQPSQQVTHIQQYPQDNHQQSTATYGNQWHNHNHHPNQLHQHNEQADGMVMVVSDDVKARQFENVPEHRKSHDDSRSRSLRRSRSRTRIRNRSRTRSRTRSRSRERHRSRRRRRDRSRSRHRGRRRDSSSSDHKGRGRQRSHSRGRSSSPHKEGRSSERDEDRRQHKHRDRDYYDANLPSRMSPRRRSSSLDDHARPHSQDHDGGRIATVREWDQGKEGYYNHPESYGYQQPGQHDSATDATGMAAKDWLCDMCSAVNFARRHECYKCASVRPEQPRLVHARSSELEVPSAILKVSNMEDSMSEEHIQQAFSAFPVVDVRLAKDKYTGAPRGFGFVEFASVGDATHALHVMQGVVPYGFTKQLRVCYARDRLSATPANPLFETATEFQVADNPLGWQPKEFNENDKEEPNSAQAGTDPHFEQSAAVQNAEQQPIVTVQTASDAYPTEQPSTANATQSGMTDEYVYDPATGYYHVPSIGGYYDPNTTLFYFPQTSQWCQYDASTQQYIPVTDSNTATEKAPGLQQQPEAQAATNVDASALVRHQASATATTIVAAATKQVTSAEPLASQRSADATQQGAKQGTVTAAVNKPKRGAVIGAAPQYNPHALLLAAHSIQPSKEKAQPGGKASNVGKANKPAGNGVSKKQIPKPANQSQRPGLGAGQAVTPPTSAAQALTASNPAAAGGKTVGTGPVQGVIHKGKWSQRAQAQ